MELADTVADTVAVAVAVVTGAAGGLGRAIAEDLAHRGMAIALVDLLADPLAQTAAQLRQGGGRVAELVCDITSIEQVAAMADRVVAELGAPAVLINSAGSLSALGPVWDVDPARWCRDATVNLCGTFCVCRHLLPAMIDIGGGYVINLVGAGTDATHHCTSAYDSSKAALIRLTEAMANEGAEAGVKAFTLMPGTVRTAMTEFILNSPEGKKHRPEFARLFAEGRTVEPAVAVRAINELLSGRLDSLSGRMIDARWDLDQIAATQDDILADNLFVLRLRRR